MIPTIAVTSALAMLAVIWFLSGLRVVKQYERAIILRFGRLAGHTIEPGLRWVIPAIDRLIKVDMRIIALDVPKQAAITRDNVPVSVDAVLFFQVVEPAAAILKIRNYYQATSQLSQTTLRSIVGKHHLDELLAERETINAALKTIIDHETDTWGVKVHLVEVKDVSLPDSMQRAIARQAEAEREKRAKIIHAEGEFEASQRLADAAGVIGSQPVAIQLRYLQTLVEVATEHNSTTIFPVPVDLIQAFVGAYGHGNAAAPKGAVDAGA